MNKNTQIPEIPTRVLFPMFQYIAPEYTAGLLINFVPGLGLVSVFEGNDMEIII
jgi:hypothetical protein